MSVKASSLTLCQYTDTMLSMPDAVGTIASALAADHKLPAAGTDAVILLAIPTLWIAGVVLLIVRKLRTR